MWGLGQLLRLVPGRSSKSARFGHYDAETMATIAMSDDLKIGWEQVIVCITLLAISLYVLSKPSSKLRLKEGIQYVLCPFSAQRLRQGRLGSRSSSSDENDYAPNEGEEYETKKLTKRNEDREEGYTEWKAGKRREKMVLFGTPQSSPMRKSNSTPSYGHRSLQLEEKHGLTQSTFLGKFKPIHARETVNNQEEEEEETEHERYTREYNSHIRYTNYRKLILPPECQLLDPKKLQEAKLSTKLQGADEATDTLSSFSFTREYMLQVTKSTLEAMEKIWNFDYIGTTCHFNFRIWKAIQVRWYKIMGWKRIGDEEEEEDLESALSEDNLSMIDFSDHHDNCAEEKYQSSNQPFDIDTCEIDVGRNNESFNVPFVASEKGDAEDKRQSLDVDIDQGENEPTVPLEDKYQVLDIDIDPNDINSPTQEQNQTPDFDTDEGATSTEHMNQPLYEDIEKEGTTPEKKNQSQTRDVDQDISTTPAKTFDAATSEESFHKMMTTPFSKDTGYNYIEEKKESSNEEDVMLSPLLSPQLSDIGECPMDVYSETKKALPPLPKIPRNRTVSSASWNYFDTASNDASLRKIAMTAPFPDSKGYILGDHFLQDPRGDTPLLVFVNSRSGSQQGLVLKAQLGRLLNPIQVWDLADGGPEHILESFKVFSRLRILVCGGDGTVSWVISALEKMNIERWPPIAILPLGTGNDLARIHGWGAGYANESLLLILKQVQEAYISLLDRWEVKIEKRKKKIVSLESKKSFTNYMSVGMDALSALQVHNLRENSPKLFFSRAVNKVWYALFGAEDAIKASCSDLPQQVVLEADGVEIPIPHDSQGLIILNIDSYLGGVPLWSRGVPLSRSSRPRRLHARRYSESDCTIETNHNGENSMSVKRKGSFDDSVVREDGDIRQHETVKDKLKRITACSNPSSCQDGRLDVISIRGNFHLGQIRVGLSNAHLLCQCSKLRIKLKKSIAVQIDGEPWKQDKATLTINRKSDPAIMLHRATEEGGGVESEVAKLLDWAEERSIIDQDAHGLLMKEFSRRIESKTRERRVRSRETVFATMTRAIASGNNLSNM